MDRKFTFEFVVADITTPIIGCDFLYSYGLTIDIRGKKLANSYSTAVTKSVNKPKISNISAIKNPIVGKMFDKYPNLTSEEPYEPGKKINHAVKINLKQGAKVQNCKPRRLSPKMLNILRKLINVNN